MLINSKYVISYFTFKELNFRKWIIFFIMWKYIRKLYLIHLLKPIKYHKKI